MNPVLMQTSVEAVPVAGIAAHAAEVDREGRFPEEGIAALRGAGLLGLGVPEEHGGPGGGPVEVVSAIERVSAACASTGMVYGMHVVATQTLLAGLEGADDAKAEAVRAIAAGEHLSTIAYSDRGTADHFWAQSSRAVADGDGVRMDAYKTWATGAGHVDSYVIAIGAPDSDDPLTIELYLVDAGAPGISIVAPFDGLGMRGNASAPLELEGVRVPAERRLGEPACGFGLMLSATLPWFVLESAACCAGIAGAALEQAARHASAVRYEHLGQTRADQPVTRARLGEAKILHMQARALLYEVAEQVAAGAPEAELGVLALKPAAAEMAVEVTARAMRIGGGTAFSKRSPLERHFRDAQAATVMAPTTDVLRDFIGKALTGQELF